jgi:hypothetical protein
MLRHTVKMVVHLGTIQMRIIRMTFRSALIARGQSGVEEMSTVPTPDLRHSSSSIACSHLFNSSKRLSRS